MRRLRVSIFTHLFAGSCKTTQKKSLSPPAWRTPPVLEVYFAHRRLRKEHSQLQTEAAPTSRCSCVCMHLGFIAATHFLQHWNILQRTTASFCLRRPAENNCILVRLQAAALHGECRLLFLPVSSNRDCVKLEPQLCVNQNNNPQRQFLTPFPDTLCDSSSVESSTLENPLRLIVSPDTPTVHAEELRRAAPALPGAPDCMCVCVCAALEGADLDQHRGHGGLVCISELPG